MGAVDPVRDREVIEFELALADLSVVEKRLDRVKRASKTGDKEALAELGSLERANASLAEGRALWHAGLDGGRSRRARDRCRCSRSSRFSTPRT